jgi:hypothetical protein
MTQAPEDSMREREGVLMMTVDTAFPGCAGVAERLRKCHADHPPRSPTTVVCDGLGALLGWCVTLSLCGREARTLERCCGGIPEIVRCPRSKCPAEDDALNRCMQHFTKTEDD